MRNVLSAGEMRSADERTIAEIGLPGAVLMENAGAAVAEAVRQRWPAARRILVLCGKGNNGGDGFVAARRLLALRPEVCLLAPKSAVEGDARLHMAAYERSGGSVRELGDVAAWRRERTALLNATEVVVDALLGTGLRDAPSGLLAEVIADVDAHCQEREIPLVGVDVPSGLACDGGEISWPSLKATLTVTFAAPKPCHVLPPACDRIGELWVADIGIPGHVLAASGSRLGLLEASDAGTAFPDREPSAHKGSFGHVLVIAGAVGKSGAAVLASTAALRTGAGLVTAATSVAALPLVAAGRAELMTEALPVGVGGGLDSAAVERALVLAEACDAVVVGPGLGGLPATRPFVRRFVKECTRPLVLDADGLNAFAGELALLNATLRQRSAATVLTPHPGEMARLVGATASEVQSRRVETARAFAAAAESFVVLKGQRTVVARPDGWAAINPTGNPGMATGGTGDVLAGVIAALLARGVGAWPAAIAGVYVHGLAGDVAAERLGMESLLALDVVDALPEAIRRVRAAR